MRIFLTGATGYIGAAVLDALVRGGHDVTALVRNNEKARRVAKRGGASGDRRSRRSRIVSRGAPTRRTATFTPRSTRAPGGGPEIDRAALEVDRLPAAKRPRTAAPDGARRDGSSSTPPASGCWASRPTRRPKSAPVNPDRHVRPGGPPRAVARGGNRALRTMIVRPGVVYGGGSGIVGDLFKSASNGLVRVVGDGNNHWPLVYDRDLADLYARLVGAPGCRGRLSRERRRRRARQRHRRRRSSRTWRCGPTCATCRSKKRAPKMGTYADALVLDQVVRSPRARALGWTPTLHSVAGNAARLLEEWRAERN